MRMVRALRDRVVCTIRKQINQHIFYSKCTENNWIYAAPDEMMGLIGMGNNPMVGATVAVAVAVEEAMKNA